jgi:hypothetical protein
MELGILLHHQKTVIWSCNRGNGAVGDNTIPAAEPPSNYNKSQQGISKPRFVTVQK